MSTKPKNETEQPAAVQLPADVFLEAIEKLSPNYVPPEKKAARERDRLLQKESLRQKEEHEQLRQKNCRHKRGNGTSRIAWTYHQLPLGSVDGVCQRCRKKFTNWNHENGSILTKDDKKWIEFEEAYNWPSGLEVVN